MCGLITACNTTKYLNDDQALLIDNEIEFLDESDLADQFGIESTMKSILNQKPNSRYIGIKREWLYIKGQEHDENYWLKDLMDRQGEPPAIQNDSLTSISENSLENYLFNQGYFDAEVDSEVTVRKKKAIVTYSITTKAPYTIDGLEYLSKDDGIQSLLDSLRRTSLMQLGEPIKDITYQLERARITTAFLDAGYADFYSGLVSPIRLDTFNGESKLLIEIFIPGGQSRHIKKSVGKVMVYNDYALGSSADPVDTVLQNGLTFYNYKKRPSVTEATINDKVYFKKDKLTSKTDFDNTYRGLGDLGVFKFISVTPITNPSDSSLMDYIIQLTPNERRVFDTGLDLNYSTVQTEGAGRNLLGLTGSARLEDRNLFRKAINLSVKAEVGAEINLAEVDSFNTFSTNVEAILSIPRFVGFPGTLKFLSLMNLGNKKLLNQKFYNSLEYRGSTKLAAQYQNVFVTDFYRYASINLSYGYDVPVNNRKRYQINTIGLNYYRPDTLSQFNQITRGEQYVLRSFVGDRLFTGFLYRDFSFFYRSKPSPRGHHWTTNLTHEFSGLEVWAVNSLYNSITNKTGKFVLSLDEDIDFARFTRLEFQYRYNYKITRSQELVFRFNPGVVVSFDSISVPYVKQFFMGGPQSLRAWQVREVGPGTNPVSQIIRNTGNQALFFSSGDIKLEMNLEYRFDLFWLLKSAVFLDAGNVWLWDDPENSGGEISGDFWKQIAVGTGVGLRLDIEFVLFRLDLGYKVRNPYKENNTYWFHHSENPIVIGQVLEDISFNLAIGYPF